MLSSEYLLMLRKFLRSIRRLGVDFRREIKSRNYLKSLSAEFIPDGSEAHLLVVKKAIYARVAKVCIETFCFHNRFTRVDVHTDAATYEVVKKCLRNLIKSQRVRVFIDQTEELTWQEQKINLICKISGSRSIFMDADLKWNSSLPVVNGLTLFVNEFSLDEHLEFNEFLTSAFTSQQKFGSMKNTSFLAWDGFEISSAQRISLANIYDKIKAESEKNPELSNKLDTIRIAEQLALSIWTERIFPGQIHFLKESDGFRDGSFVESSYFGATGSHF